MPINHLEGMIQFRKSPFVNHNNKKGFKQGSSVNTNTGGSKADEE